MDDDLDVIVPLKKRGKGIVYDFVQETNEQSFISEFKAEKNATGLIKSFTIDSNFFKYKNKRNN